MLFASLNAFMLAGMGLFAKMLATYFGPVEVTFFRNIVSLVLLIFWLAAMRKFWVLKTDRPWAHVFRSAIGTIGITLGAWALAMMPLAETTVLLFTSPLFTVILSIFFLKEKVGLFRIGAVIAGFSGIAVMAGPMGAIPALGLAVGLGWGFFSGAVDVCLRWLGQTENSYTTVFYFLLFGTLSTGLYWPFAETSFADISTENLWIILGLGLTGVAALVFKTKSYRFGEASMVAPVMYTMLIWAVAFDFLFWGRLPGGNVLLGATIVIASNMFILYRENRKSRAASL